MHVWYIKQLCLCGENNNIHVSFYLYRKAPLYIRLRLNNLKIWEKPIIRPNPELKVILSFNKFKVSILPDLWTFDIRGLNIQDTMLERLKHEERSFEAQGSNVRYWQKLSFEPKLNQTTYF